MGKRHRRMICGRYTAECLFSRTTRYDCPKARAEKRHHTSQVQQALNDKNALIYNAAVIAGTFLDDPTSLFVSLTLDDDHYPFADAPWKSWNVIHKFLINYIARLQRLAKRRESEVAYGWSPGMGDFGRYHVHMIIKGLSPEDVQTMWGHGDANTHHLYTDIDFFSDRDWLLPGSKEINPERIAQYMVNNAKPLRKVGGRLIHFSRNCVKPTVEESTPVSDGYNLSAPDDSAVCDRREENTMYSSFAFLSYIRVAPKRRRRRKKLRGRTP